MFCTSLKWKSGFIFCHPYCFLPKFCGTDEPNFHLVHQLTNSYVNKQTIFRAYIFVPIKGRFPSLATWQNITQCFSEVLRAHEAANNKLVDWDFFPSSVWSYVDCTCLVVERDLGRHLLAQMHNSIILYCASACAPRWVWPSCLGHTLCLCGACAGRHMRTQMNMYVGPGVHTQPHKLVVHYKT